MLMLTLNSVANHKLDHNMLQALGGGFQAVWNAGATIVEQEGASALYSGVGWMVGYGARFSTEIYTRGCHWILRLLA
jgi:hypothetical protein